MDNPKKPYNLHPTTYTLKRGFTLLEILIASAIFAALVLFAVSAFSLNIRGQAQQKLAGAIVENGQFIIDNITQEIRYAQAISEIENDSLTIIDRNGIERRYYQEDAGFMLDIGGNAQNLISESLELGGVQFSGEGTVAAGGLQLKRPYVEIEITIQDKNFAPKLEADRNKQIFRATAVTRGFKE